MALAVAALLLLAVPTVLMWDDGGGRFTVAALVFGEVALALLVVPALAGRKGRDPIRWLLGSLIVTPFVTGALLLFLPPATDDEAPAA